MKKTLAITTFLFIVATINIQAQLEPFFKTTIHFEDAIGNRDSIVFGYDITATPDMDEAFGEEAILTPFDSIFEVRAGSIFTSNGGDKLTKYLITGTEGIGDPVCYSGSGSYVYIHALHQPIKVWWDKEELLAEECQRGAWIVNHIIDGLAGPIPMDEIPPLYYCMADVDTGYFEMTEEALGTEAIVYIEKEVEGIGLTTIYGLRLILTPWWGYTPCFWITDVLEGAPYEHLELYPNPASSTVFFNYPDELNISSVAIYSADGQHLLEQGAVSEINVSELAPALYYVIAYTDIGNKLVGRFIKN